MATISRLVRLADKSAWRITVLNAEELRVYVGERVRHDYETQVDTLNPEEILAAGKGRCGQRAAVFQHLAKQNGIESRIILYRGHVATQVYENGAWTDYDCTLLENIYHKQLLDHIKQGPVIGYSTDPDFMTHSENVPWAPGEYTLWLGTLQKNGVQFLLPRDLLHGAHLNPDKPNVIIRHDLCTSLGAWMGMVHEENQVGVRSVSYIRVEDASASPDLFRMFEHEGFEIGLHSTAITAHDTTLEDAMTEFLNQLAQIHQAFNVETVQAHGYDDAQGNPLTTYTQLDEEISYSFRKLVDLNPNFAGRVADSMGVMTPHIDALSNMRPGKLYYCLWHPEYYEVWKGWVRYFGLQQDGDLHGNLPKLNRIIKDTLYFNDIQKPHLLTAAQIVNDNVKEGLVLDLAAGWAILGLFIHPNLHYVAVDNEYKRMKAAQALYQSLLRPLPEFVCRDYEQAKLPEAECVVLIGWEGDLGHKPDFKKLANLTKPNGQLIISYISETRESYTDMSQAEMKRTLTEHGFETVQVYDRMYPNGFPREIIHARRNK